MTFVLKWFLIDRLIVRLLRHPRVQTYPAFQQAGVVYQSVRPHLFPLVVRRLLLGVTIAVALFFALAVTLIVLLIQAIH